MKNKKRNQKNTSNAVFKFLTFFASSLTIVIIISMIISLFYQSIPAIQKFGFVDFIFTREWSFNKDIYGAFRPLSGTILTSIGALLLAIPIALGIAIFITEICPAFLRNIISSAIELLAAIPSIIYGMWGLFTLAPLIEGTVQKAVSSTIGLLPVIGPMFQSEYAGGVSIFTASIVLSIMVIPFIAAIARDTFTQTPDILKESAYGLGATKWEVVRYIVLPYSKTGVQSGIIIAAGRALGETMAIAYVIGNRHGPLNSIFDPYTTITSVLANEFNEAVGTQLSTLFLLAFILFIANFITLAIAKIYSRRGLSNEL